MTLEEVFAAWAPEGAPWSHWAKPVLFACMEREGAHVLEAAAATTGYGIPEAAAEMVRPLLLEEGTAVVIDLPGALGIDVGLALAARGWRPVPLYNSAASGGEARWASQGMGSFGVCIDVAPLMAGLWRGAKILRDLRWKPTAPPLFLLDADRRTGRLAPAAGIFDNRWVSLPTDFPSARMLRERGISRALLLSTSGAVAADLAHTLLRWQEAGIDISAAAAGAAAAPVILRKPRWYRSLWHGLLEAAGFRRSWLGGFGARLSDSGSGG